MEEQKPVFFDPKGRRGAFAGGLGAAIGLIVAVASTLTIAVALVAIPTLPSYKTNTIARTLKERQIDITKSGFRSIAFKHQLQTELVKERKRPARSTIGRTIVLGYYAPWEQAGLSSLRAHADALTHLAPAWLSLGADGHSLDFRDYDFDENPSNREVVDIARRQRLSILPVLSNSVLGKFDPHRGHLLLTSPKDQTVLIDHLLKWIEQEDYQGINLDLENLADSDYALLPKFLGKLSAAFKPSGKLVTAAVEVDNEAIPVADMAEACDWIVVMLYDEHDQSGSAGPIASIPWTSKNLDAVLKTVPEDKVVAGLGNYAYDWKVGQKGAETPTFEEAMSDAEGYRSESASQVVKLDPESLNNTFEYDDDNNKRHVVWMLDAVSAYDQWVLAKDAGVRGAALWSLGAEDPSLWSFFNRKSLANTPDPNPLTDVRFPFEVSYVGQGEILSITGKPQNGARTVQTDSDSGLITGSKYLSYSHPYVIKKSGYKPGVIALTFDDGPDPEWTPKILDVLRDLHAPATFFVVGSNAERYPGIIQRAYAEGHEIGSHTFLHPNLGYVSDERAQLELNLTQMAISGLTGRSTVLFRPPYNADSQPDTPVQLRPVEIADRLGYVTVGENVDPLDWSLKVSLSGGGDRRKTADDIVDFVVNDLARRKATQEEGNILLLHDAGGDRSATVEAVRKLVPKLRSLGYKFVLTSALMDKSRDQVMPPVPFKDRLSYWLGRFVLTGFYDFLAFLGWAFNIAIVLGIARSLFVTVLAIVDSRRSRALPIATTHSVSVVIAAYNEAAVIARTVESVLGSDCQLQEVIVVDDGSTDDTASVIEKAHGDDPRVKVVRKLNGGKASALNLGIELATGDIVFSIDADTQVEPDAIRLLVARFEDEKTAAVAGNVRVGNEINTITRWQSLEYTASQNIDRRAYSLLNSITVVPGAIGAWRRSAVLEVGGYQTDTLAEDMDLTWRLRRAGYRLLNEPRAVAWTEAPDTFKGFFRQRFRWAFGTLQCLWKQRRALGTCGWFGWLALPTLWMFQVVFQVLGPLVDLGIAAAFGSAALALTGGSGENGSAAMTEALGNLTIVGFMYALFFAVEFVSAFIAFRMERRRLGLLWWLFLQRLAYRQMMYGVVFKAIGRAVQGGRQGWGKLDRKGTVTVPR